MLFHVGVGINQDFSQRNFHLMLSQPNILQCLLIVKRRKVEHAIAQNHTFLDCSVMDNIRRTISDDTGLYV